MIDFVLDDDHAANYPVEFLNSIEYSGLPQHKIPLKKGAIIILLRNLDTNKGHCNGTRYMIVNITRRLVTATRLNCSDGDEIVLIPRIPNCSKENEFPFILKRLQFPLRLAYGMTFNRSQGQSLQKRKSNICLGKNRYPTGRAD